MILTMFVLLFTIWMIKFSFRLIGWGIGSIFLVPFVILALFAGLIYFAIPLIFIGIVAYLIFGKRDERY